MTKVNFHFDAVDTWFFRESRPHGTIGGIELSSVFPPSAYTLSGVVRTLIGESLGVDWEEYRRNKEYQINGNGKKLKDVIGYGSDLGPLKFTGPYLKCLGDGERLYPVPSLLMMKDETINKLLPGKPAICDLGKRRLPAIISDKKGWKSLEERWITGAGLAAVLSSDTPLKEQIIPSEKLFTNESRLGIGRNNDRRTADNGLLYQTQHIRPLEGVAIEVEVEGLDKSILDKLGSQSMIRMGGEGRLASVGITQSKDNALPVPENLSGDQIMLVLLTHADFGGDWKPLELNGIEDKDADGNKIWKGIIKGIPLTLVSAITGKAAREGGWDVAGRKPKTVYSLVPAGSVYFCRIEGDIQNACKALHEFKVGREAEYGRGELAVGIW